MPHATSETSVTNGDQPSSKFISHVTSYPVVNDSIETFKQHPVGKQSLEIADRAYQTFGKPVEPYAQNAFSYVKPYAQKADEMADSGLGHVDQRFPIVKEDTHTVIDTAKSYAFWPYSYLTSTWQDEYTKTAKHNNRGAGLATSIMALMSTEMKIASDFFQVVADFLGPKYADSKKKGSDYVRHAQDTANHYKQIGQGKADEYVQYGQQKTQQAQGQVEQTTEEAKRSTA
ncbi:hypothetical protein LTR08_001261 [Meristemomyces frigidus]|nr:hypothetical protein LTR08_001261 [Meristemomyces frigidus]